MGGVAFCCQASGAACSGKVPLGDTSQAGRSTGAAGDRSKKAHRLPPLLQQAHTDSRCRSSWDLCAKLPPVMGKRHPQKELAPSPLEGTSRVPQGSPCGRGSGHPTPSKALKKKKSMAREITNPERGSSVEEGCAAALGEFHTVSVVKSSPSTGGMNQQHSICRALAERPGCRVGSTP